MAEIRTVTTLRRKRDEISASIRLYEQQLAQARADLAHVTAAIRIFEASGDPKGMARYVDTYRLFKRGETWAICQVALAKHGTLTTRELALEVMQVKGLDVADKVLAKGVGQQLIHVLRTRSKTGRLVMDGKRKAAAVWRLPPDAALL
jgi:hypothetical protein